MHYAYLDESGGVTPFSGSRYLVVAVLIARNRTLSITWGLKGEKPGFSEKPGFFPRTIEMIQKS
jgi:hypothetical protein